jgi:hypothetical protein
MSQFLIASIDFLRKVSSARNKITKTWSSCQLGRVYYSIYGIAYTPCCLKGKLSLQYKQNDYGRLHK